MTKNKNILMDEKRFVEKCCEVFSKHFEIFKEVKSQCGKGRIDLILKYYNHFFGIECKLPDKKDGHKIYQYVNQAIMYSKMKWSVGNEYITIPIFICPPLSYNYFILNESSIIHEKQEYHKDRHEELYVHHTFNGLLGGFNVGEVRKIEAGYHFSMGNKSLFIKYEKNNKEYAFVHQKNYSKHMIKLRNHDGAI